MKACESLWKFWEEGRGYEILEGELKNLDRNNGIKYLWEIDNKARQGEGMKCSIDGVHPSFEFLIDHEVSQEECEDTNYWEPHESVKGSHVAVSAR